MPITRSLASSAPAAWVATELGRQYVWDGFPWALLGYSQITWLPVAQIASAVGVYGLSGLLSSLGEPFDDHARFDVPEPGGRPFYAVFRR